MQALEAASSGIPVILPKQEFNSNPEIIKDFALLVNNNPDSFKNAIKKILLNKSLREELIQKGLNVTKTISSKLMEQKENKLYLNILSKN